MPQLKNPGPLLVDKVRGYFDRLPPWLRDRVTIRIEKQKVDAKINELDPSALESELRQEVTDDKLRTNRYLGDGEAGSGNDTSGLPASHPSEIVITGTGQVANVTETIGSSETHLVEGPPLQDGTSEQVGDLWVTKKVEAPTFDDKVFQLTREDLIPSEFKALVPEKLEAHTVDGVAELPTLGAGESVRREEQKKVGVKTVSVQSRDLSSPPVLTARRIDPQWNGAELLQEQKIVPASTADITQVFGMTDASIKPIDGVNAIQETWNKVETAFPKVKYQRFDADLQTIVTTEQSVEPVGSNYTAVDLDVDFDEKYIDALHKLRRVDRVDATPAVFSTWTTQSITFPGLLFGLSFALVDLAATNRKEPQWIASIRFPFTIPTSIQVVTEFFWTQPPDLAAYQWRPTDIIFKGISYSLNLQSVLTDAISNAGVTYASDAYYKNTVDRFSVSATYPTASAYISLLNTPQVLSSVVDRYKRLWVRKISYVWLQ
jgi:hypothetical protein